MAEIEKLLIPSENNLRQIIRILLGLLESQEQLDQQCVLPYVDDGSKVYTSPMLTIYNNGKTYGLYMCKYTTSGQFNPSSWIEVCSVEVNELTAADIDAYMTGISHQTWDYFKNIIQDDAVSTTKTWSSSKTYEEIQESYADSIAYTVKYVAKAKLITYKKVTSITDVKDDSTLYLVPDSSGNYSIYVLDSTTGSPLQLSDTSISLDDYYTKSEIDSTFLTQSDALSTYKDITSYGNEQGNLSFTTDATTVTDAINEIDSHCDGKIDIDGAKARRITYGTDYNKAVLRVISDIASPAQTASVSFENETNNDVTLYNSGGSLYTSSESERYSNRRLLTDVDRKDIEDLIKAYITPVEYETRIVIDNPDTENYNMISRTNTGVKFAQPLVVVGNSGKFTGNYYLKCPGGIAGNINMYIDVPVPPGKKLVAPRSYSTWGNFSNANWGIYPWFNGTYTKSDGTQWVMINIAVTISDEIGPKNAEVTIHAIFNYQDI